MSIFNPQQNYSIPLLKQSLFPFCQCFFLKIHLKLLPIIMCQRNLGYLIFLSVFGNFFEELSKLERGLSFKWLAYLWAKKQGTADSDLLILSLSMTIFICLQRPRFIIFIQIILNSSITKNMDQQLCTSKKSISRENSLPRSSCSIEKCERVQQKSVKFSNRQILLSQKKQNMKQRGYSDRFLPMRKMPKSAKDLYNDQTEWMQEQQQITSPRKDKRGLTVTDIYKMQVLGQGSINRDEYPANDITSFSNSNILKYGYKDENASQKELNKLFSNSLIQIPEEAKIKKSKKERKINKVPAKVLDAPGLYDDYYLNLIDWSMTNLLAVGLSNSVYLWNAGNSKVARLVDVGTEDMITSTNFGPTGNTLAVGTHSGEVQIWDCVKQSLLHTYEGHTARVGSLAWNNVNMLASGSRDKNILLRDLRTHQCINKMIGHKQQVCGLRWSFDQQQLASGGNDNRLCIWSPSTSTPTFSLMKHSAAVKALAWSPHQHGLLVSGGGTADRTIRFWNSMNGEETKCLNVGSQVCNLMFARNVNQLVSTHGYSLNEINVWSMPKMEKLQTLTGHTYRVLYLAMNPDGTTIVTGAGDETLRFWNIFPKKQKQAKEKSNLNAESIYLR